MRKFFNALMGRPTEVQQLRVMPQNVTVPIPTGKSLLEAALSAGVPYPHNCTVGTCAACKAKLKQGRVREATPFGYTLSKQELDAGYILTCQAFARDALTELELPDPGAELPPVQQVQGSIVATTALTHDIRKVSVRTEQPVHYVAGQYATLFAPGLARGRHYSFADAPQREGRRELTFFIRKVPGGAFTDALFSGRLDGQPLRIEAPQGGFHLRAGHAPMVCVVGGSGLGPLLSVLEHARNNRIRRRCVLLFGARTQADLYLMEALSALASSWPEPFVLLPVLSHEAQDSGWTGARGWVTDHIASACGDMDLKAAQGYLCGPPPMIDAAIAGMTTLGMPIDAIFYDKFTDGRDDATAP